MSTTAAPGHEAAEATARDAGRGSPLLAGVVAGQAGLAVFLGVHALWILPIWEVLGLGVVVAGLGGAAAGWAYAELRPALPAVPLRAWAAVTAGALLVLSPTLLVGALGVPLPLAVIDDSVLAPVPPGDLPRLVGQFTLELVVLPMALGAALGWRLLRTRRAAVATALAALAFALGPGHNNPFFFRFMGLEGGLFGLALMTAIVATSAAVLVGLDGALRPA